MKNIHDPRLIDLAVDQLKDDVTNYEFQPFQELLRFVTSSVVYGFLNEERQAEWDKIFGEQ